ncbi:hypothetical protein INR49_026932 [Caranx melampygus]|nr:hypothetical protein INR49_026932 [Caranx melampygus]
MIYPSTESSAEQDEQVSCSPPPASLPRTSPRLSNAARHTAAAAAAAYGEEDVVVMVNLQQYVSPPAGQTL